MKIYAVSDIHAERDKLVKALIQAELVDQDLNWKSKYNKLIICGDSIDRGPHSKETLDLLIHLSNSGNLVILHGNHEEMLLDSLRGNSQSAEWFSIWLNSGGQEMMINLGASKKKSYSINELKELINPEHIKFIQKMKRFHIEEIEDQRVLFVHAGVNPSKYLKSIAECEDHLWIRDTFYRAKNVKFLKSNYGVDRVIFGHTPTRYITKDNESKMQPVSFHEGALLCIDTGSNYEDIGFVTIIEVLPNFNYRIVAQV